jgi:hypothetical protein
MQKFKSRRLRTILLSLALSSAFISVAVVGFSFSPEKKEIVSVPVVEKTFDPATLLYESLNLDSLQLSREAFDFAIKGYRNLLSRGMITKDSILTIADFSLSSAKKRLFVIDMNNGKLLYNTYVSHGRNSGLESATSFSNDINSFQTSLGFYVTRQAYKGEHGLSLRLDGMEKGINDNAYNRGIVIHAAPYVNEKMISRKGYIGRSLGCPAIPVKLHRAIIQKIKDGSCLFLYGPDKNYVNSSGLISDSLVADTLV